MIFYGKVVFSLDGKRALLQRRTTEICTVVQQKDPRYGYFVDVVLRSSKIKYTEPLKSFPLRKVTAEELTQLHRSKKPGFVLKYNQQYYYTQIPRDLRMTSDKLLNGVHQCAIVNHECKHLSAASDENGGCAKVRNMACHIEKYDWILVGYETFNTNMDIFVVNECLHYVATNPKH